MDHGEIRFRLLYSLYKRYYEGDIKQWQHIDDVIDAESRLKRVGKNLVFGDAGYLADNHLIEIDSEHGQIRDKASQSIYPGKLRISARGIDEVEQVINGSVFARIEAQKPRQSYENTGSLYLRVRPVSIKGLIEPEVRALVKERAGRLHKRHISRKGDSNSVLSKF